MRKKIYLMRGKYYRANFAICWELMRPQLVPRLGSDHPGWEVPWARKKGPGPQCSPPPGLVRATKSGHKITPSRELPAHTHPDFQVSPSSSGKQGAVLRVKSYGHNPTEELGLPQIQCNIKYKLKAIPVKTDMSHGSGIPMLPSNIVE